MKLHVINSNSDGNCYLLTDSTGQTIIIECGVDFRKIQRALNFDFSNVVGCLVSHEHKDHCKAVKEVLSKGCEVYSSIKTHIEMGTERHIRANKMRLGSQYNIGSYTVLPFGVQHDAVEPFGFLIKHYEMGVCLFATDTYYLENTFEGLNQIILESNYASDIVENKAIPSFLLNRIMASHMSLNQCKATLKANDLKSVQNIVLIHLSNSNADGPRFKKEIEAVTGKPVHIATAGLKIENFNLNLF